jgi:hypothetical protein
MKKPRWIYVLIISLQILVTLLVAVIAVLLIRQSRLMSESSSELSKQMIESVEETRNILQDSLDLHEQTNSLIQRSNRVMEEFNSLIEVYNRIVLNQNELLTVELRPQIDLALHVNREGLEQIIISNKGKPLLNLGSRGYAYMRLAVVKREDSELFSFAIPYYNYYSYPEYDNLLSGEVAVIESRGFFGERMTPEEIAESFRGVLRQDGDWTLLSASLERYVSLEYTDNAQREYSEMYYIDEAKFYRIDPIESRKLMAAYVKFKQYEYSFLIDGTTTQKIERMWKDLLQEIGSRG